jgi:hypothetical protein
VHAHKRETIHVVHQERWNCSPFLARKGNEHELEKLMPGFAEALRAHGCTNYKGKTYYFVSGLEERK